MIPESVKLVGLIMPKMESNATMYRITMSQIRGQVNKRELSHKCAI